MAHARKQIRDEVVTRVTGLLTTGPRVYRSRSRTMSPDKVPGLKVWTNEEQVEDESSYDGQRRALLLDVVAYSKHAAPDDQLDQICAEVEAALAADPTFGGLIEAAYLLETEHEYDDTVEKPVGTATMRWRIHYSVDADDPETIV